MIYRGVENEKMKVALTKDLEPEFMKYTSKCRYCKHMTESSAENCYWCDCGDDRYEAISQEEVMQAIEAIKWIVEEIDKHTFEIFTITLATEAKARVILNSILPIASALNLEPIKNEKTGTLSLIHEGIEYMERE